MTLLPLTKHQKVVYDWIKKQNDKEGVCPSLEDIADGLVLNKTTISYHVREIVRKGWLHKDDTHRWEIWIDN